ncbi:HK97-gp10 family putative phage morphogenesis protein [Agrobacterium tumefaciens]|uniref:HK97-gp10 family putative phage morphogenesis protein n=1 Tax=Agrobacterium tumefaciens TaxID=358 RepID=UPI00080F97A9|nr:HK97-gp10 family putative phage morphogenesis protein [Agrobacterium tumefaciens]NSL22840.1 HK97 gp10 family phage protein [Agrobacterium tumefaciens]NTC56773.1 HK97 gp10 family phage protein [Agrobacterium tumefaciens]NTC62573.1 HK97 gp10 family phage protein [Agrobacterium tumefaciens]NTC66303.1 HK97 gp10 family phage protein [Agrobacterium tumefaciens]NTC74883.1 HK97 gp10 family phage protein [Agrobacterium tumefaciens]
MDDGGINRIKQRLNAIPKNVRAAMVPELLKSGNDLAVTARILAPRDSGALQDSIAVTPGGSNTPPYSTPGGRVTVPELAVAVTAGNKDARYAHLVEHGTQEAAAQPFFWPAFRLLRKKITGRIKRAASKAVKQNWGGK